MIIYFTKMHGLGNDFILLNGISQNITLSPDQIRFLADRHIGIGFDQLLLVSPAENEQADFHYTIFNANGSEAETCGNGARCFAWYVYHQGLTQKKTLVLETKTGRVRTWLEDGNLVMVEMQAPKFDPADIPFIVDINDNLQEIDIDGKSQEIHVVSMGNPHAVIIVDDVTQADVSTLGPLIENHHRFPEKTNVGFMEIKNRTSIRLRVYERGTGETMACGSGACAAAVIANRLGLVDPRVTVELPGGRLLIEWHGDNNTPVKMTGPATLVYEGKIEL